MKRTSTTKAPPFARKIESKKGHRHYTKREINNCINGIARELRTCPEEKFNQLLNVLTSMKLL